MNTILPFYNTQKSKMSLIDLETSLCIHSALPECTIDVVNENEYFGVLSVKPRNMPSNQNQKFILFTVDRTGSMSECNKMTYVKDTFKNMIQFIANECPDIYIQVNVFNTTVETCIPLTKIDLDIVDELIQKIDSIEAEGATAIDAALRSAKDTMLSYIAENPRHSACHIFMTDGDPTFGEKSHSRLSSMVSDKYPNTFIGFGRSHNSKLLRRFGDVDMASYDFVDNVEHTGLVYGEIMHNLLSSAFTDVTIRAVNGKLYNWKTNSWCNELNEYSLVNDTEKNYHVRCENRYDLKVEIYGKTSAVDTKQLHDTVYVIPYLINSETGTATHHTEDLSKYVFRQAVLEKLFLAKSEDLELSMFNDIDEIRDLKHEISQLFTKIRRYMQDTDQQDDSMLRQLVDDLTITYKTIGTPTGRILALSRQSTQGRQQSRNVSAYPNSNASTMVPRFTENSITPIQNAVDSQDDFIQRPPTFPAIQTDEEIDNYEPSDNPISCYSTPASRNMMRSMSQPYSQSSS